MNREKKITVIESTKQIIQDSGNNLNEKLRVAAYARVSTEQDEQQSSYEAQVNYYTGFIRNNPDWKFVGVFADEGITGTNTKKRDGFNRMIEKALNGEIDLILTKSISRFARNTVDTLQIVRELKTAGVEVRFEKENLHTFDPKCEVMLTILASLAQEESRSISENIRWGQQRSMQSGKVHMAYSCFLGYRKGEDGRPEIVEEEAEIVRSIYQMFLDGMTMRHIASHLTSEGILTPKKKRIWSVSTVRSILTNEKYKGDALLQKTYTTDYLTKKVKKNDGEVRQYLVENSHDPIIEPDVFDLVQDKIEKQSGYRAKIRDNSPFSNKLICADCGGFYGHKVWHNHANTERYDVWYCNQKYTNALKCQTPVLRGTTIKQAFEELLKKIGYDDPSYSDTSWKKTVDYIEIFNDSRFVFHLADSRIVELMLPK
ncbi:MAG: recombinase family protein [Ruminococcus sp.]|nr:recombinase family protein [Ruminococcus sp.]